MYAIRMKCLKILSHIFPKFVTVIFDYTQINYYVIYISLFNLSFIYEEQKHIAIYICLVFCRWLPLETINTQTEYLSILSSSHTTLHPVGQNPECYRLYEAMSYGSIPIIEDPSIDHMLSNENNSMSRKVSHDKRSSKCDSLSSFRLLKLYSPPVFWIKDWRLDLPPLIELLKAQSPSEHYVHRERIRRWYASFKSKMAQQFFAVVKQKFNLN